MRCQFVIYIGLFICSAAHAVATESPSSDDAYYLEETPVTSTTQPTTVAHSSEDVYYLEPKSQEGQKTGKAKPGEPSKEPEKAMPPVDLQKAEFFKILQARDNPSSSLLKYKNVGLAGLININARGQTKPRFMKSRASDVSVALAKLNLEGNLDQWAYGHVGFLYADYSEQYYPRVAGKDIHGVVMDEIYFTFRDFEKSPIYLRVGRQYLPFGSYHRYPILKPFTQELTETRQNSIQLGFVDQNGLYANIFGFEGLRRLTSERKKSVYNGGGMIGYMHLRHSLGFDVGLSYLNNIADVGAINHTFPHNSFGDYVSGLSFHADLLTGPFSFAYRYVSALNHFSDNDFAYQTSAGVVRGAKPSAGFLRAGYAFKTCGRDSKINLGYQWSNEAYNVSTTDSTVDQIAKKRLSFTYAVAIWKRIIVGLEYDRDHDYNKNHGGTNKLNHILTLRITGVL